MINGTYAEQAEGLRFLQGNPLGHQLTEHQVKISQDDGHHNACQGLAVGQVPLRHPYRQHLAIPVAADALEKKPARVMATWMVDRNAEESSTIFSSFPAVLSPSS